MRNRKKIPYIEFFCGVWYDNRAKAAMIGAGPLPVGIWPDDDPA